MTHDYLSDWLVWFPAPIHQQVSPEPDGSIVKIRELEIGTCRTKFLGTPDPTDSIFKELGLQPAAFDVQTGGGKSFVSGHRVVWMEITNRSTGQKVSDKLGTTTKNQDSQRVKLLQSLLREFR